MQCIDPDKIQCSIYFLVGRAREVDVTDEAHGEICI